MASPADPRRVYFIGIKGTGMCALAELFHNGGIDVSGSDRGEVFYTDAILKELDIPYYENFDAGHLPSGADLVVYSAAYNAESNVEIAEAQKRGLPLLKYTDALGEYSARFDSSGIAGVHGKTTTTALAGTLLRAAGIPAQVLAGSAVADFGGRSTLSLGGKYFVAETCEYRKHFLAFHPRRLVLTSVESDHQDFFPTYESIRDAFVEYALRLPQGGLLVYCADDAGAAETAELALAKRRDIVTLGYGFSPRALVRITSCRVEAERGVFSLTLPGAETESVFRLRVPGRHLVLDAAAALVLTGELLRAENRNWDAALLEKAAAALDAFGGSRRRSEIIGEVNDILFMDDYGHHPTAVRATLEGLKEFYPRRRLVASFMSHTYTRTAALIDEFAAALVSADIVFLHKIYASAREAYRGGVSGRTLFEKTRALKNEVYYTEECADAAAPLEKILRPGDLFITMGAGDNWRLGRLLYEKLGGAAR
ncbi:MAG: UDP-N-acetylmuramate--L-alanine ligase [Treponema sp.]|jgi:UDP-N-acetylmuramate--alanine ligase|nr:UDP-N-acetylmuramate--L-alanine ligase [Treponema sp.]